MAITSTLMCLMHALVPPSRSTGWRRRANPAWPVVTALALSGCAAITTHPQAGAPGSEPAMNRPQVAVTRQAVIPGTPEAVFRFITAEDVLPKVLTGYGPLPAVVGTSQNTGAWDRPGSARLIHLADGSTVREEVTHHDGPRFFAYRVWAFGNPIVRSLTDEARGEWTFAAAPGGTEVTWTYAFAAKSRLHAVPLSGIVRWLWRGYMDVCLDNAVRQMTPKAVGP